MKLHIVPDATRAPSPFFATALALTRAQADQWRESRALEAIAERRRTEEAERPFRVLLDGRVVGFSNRRMAELFAELWKGEVIP